MLLRVIPGGLQRPVPDHCRERALSVLMVLFAVFIFVSPPLVTAGISPKVLSWTLVPIGIATLAVVSRSRLTTLVIVLAFLLNAIIASVRQLDPTPIATICDPIAWLLLASSLALVVGRAVFGPGRITIHRVQGAIFLYLDLALIFAHLFRLVTLFVPDAFSASPHPVDLLGSVTQYLHFSLTTLTTVGYGDVVPVHPAARSLADLEAVIGQMFPATFLARLVSLELQARGSGEALEPRA